MIGLEIGGAGRECVFGKADGGDEAVGGGEQELAVGEFVIEEAVGNGADVAGGGADGRIDGDGIGESCRSRGRLRRRGCGRLVRPGGTETRELPISASDFSTCW